MLKSRENLRIRKQEDTAVPLTWHCSHGNRSEQGSQTMPSDLVGDR